jgi:hypothetical protein
MRTKAATVFVKTVRGDGYTEFYALDIPTYIDKDYDWNFLTAWPLPSHALPIGSSGREWPESLRIVRRKTELRKCQEWYARMEESFPRMTFFCTRKGDRVEVQNSVGGMYGQFHSHDAVEFEKWKSNALTTGARESDFVWM